MIRYALQCRQEHGFEAWFRDSVSFDRQSESGQLTCPACGTADVRKAVMAPSVRRSRKAATAGDLAPVGPVEVQEPVAGAPPPVAPIADEGFARVRAGLRELHARLKQHAQDVGPAFPDQARRIHEGEEPARAIYGTATDAEVRSLLDDGIGVMPIPALPDDRN